MGISSCRWRRVESALQSFGYLLLQDHLTTCVVEEIQKWNVDVVDEARNSSKSEVRTEGEARETVRTEKFDVTGMTCAACQANVTRCVGKLDGVETVDVSLLANQMTVTYDENKMDEGRIAAAVREIGYGAPSSEILRSQSGRVSRPMAG